MNSTAKADHTPSAAELERIIEEKTRSARHLTGASRWLVGGVAVAWSLFQLALPTFILLRTLFVCCIHLAFALTLSYLLFPAVRGGRIRGFFRFLSSGSRLGAVSIVIAVLAAGSALYYLFQYTQISARQGTTLPPWDLAAGLLLIVLLLEATRRALGWALPAVAAMFIAYAFFAPYLPEVIAGPSVPLNKLVNKLSLSRQGIFTVPLQISAQTIFLFVLLGAMLERSGGGRWFVDLAFSLVGRYRGGPAKAAVLASGLTGMVSGSSIANVVTTGTFTIPLMKDSGYPAEKAAAVEVAASTNGQLMPPVMGAAAFIIAEYCGVPYREVIRAAFVPAVISYIALIYIVHLEAVKLGLKGLSRENLPRFGRVLVRGWHFLLPIAALVTLLVMGFTARMAAFYAICTLAGLIVIRDMISARPAGRSIVQGARRGMRTLVLCLEGGGRNMVNVALACATAGIVVGIVAMGLGNQITGIVDALAGGNILLILLYTAVASLILGMGLPTTATYIVMASLIAPVIVNLGPAAGFTVPLIAAHLFCFYFGILADDTPPVGLAAYAGAAIAGSNPIKTGVQGFTYDLRTAILPFIFIFNTDLLLIDVHAWWHIGLIFAAGTGAMLAFAALTQHHMRVRNRWYESILLAASVLLLLAPVGKWVHPAAGTPAAPLWTNKFLWYAVGAVLLGMVYLFQCMRHGGEVGERTRSTK